MMIKLGPILRPAGPCNRARLLVLLGCLVGVRGDTLVIAPLAKQHASPESAWDLTEGHIEHVVVGRVSSSLLGASHLVPSSQELLPKVPFQDFFGQRTIGMVRASTAPLAPLGTAAAHALYQDGLSRAAQVTDHSVVASTLAKRYAVGQAIEAWLARLPPPFPQSLLAARPEDVLCFMQQHWVLHHGRSVVAGVDHPVASPQGVAGSLSHLSTLFDTLGRSGPYNALTGTGNPCDSPAVRAYKRGYQQVLWQAGYQEVAAVPMVESKVLALMAYLHQLARTAHTVVKAISFFRDALLVEHAWLTAYRGKEGGMLCLPDLHHADLTPIFPDGYSPGVGIVPI
eukprot:gene4269-biopygen21992